MTFLSESYRTFFGPDLVVAPAYLGIALLIALALWAWRRPGQPFWHWVAPRRIWAHRSTRADLSLFVIGRVATAAGLFSRFALTPVFAAWVAGLMADPLASPDRLSPLGLALILFLLSDFSYYWSHRLFHANSTLWPLHAVHHSAEVLTPFTTYRQHPVGILVSTVFQTAVIGALMGLIVGAIDPTVGLAEIAGVNAFIVSANIGLAAFHHSHIWISYGPILERLFISPAQHQIHHSTNPMHFNRNYGNTLAIWDWMFGTLYLIKDREELVFGLDGKADAPLATHRLGPILLDPLKRMIRPTR